MFHTFRRELCLPAAPPSGCCSVAAQMVARVQAQFDSTSIRQPYSIQDNSAIVAAFLAAIDGPVPYDDCLTVFLAEFAAYTISSLGLQFGYAAGFADLYRQAEAWTTNVAAASCSDAACACCETIAGITRPVLNMITDILENPTNAATIIAAFNALAVGRVGCGGVALQFTVPTTA